MNSDIHIKREVKEETINLGRFTIVKLIGTDGKTGVGISKCSHDDRYNAERGMQIAKGRAKKALYIKTYKKDKKLQHIYMG